MKQSSLSWITLIALSLVWGSSFILMKEGLKAFSSDEVAALRIAIAFLFLLPFLFTPLGKKPYGVKHYANINFKENWRGLILMGVFGNLIPAFLFTEAETQISSSLTGMLNALTPLFTILLGMLIFKTSVNKFQLIGVLVGLVGAIALLGFGNSNEQSSNKYYSLLVVGATFCYAISVNGIKKYLSGLNSFTAAVGSFAIIGPIAIAYLFANTHFQEHLSAQPQGFKAFGFICILAIFGTSLSIIAFNTLIKQAGAVFASSCTYLIPIVAIGWGVLAGETVSMIQLLSVAIIILGVWLINKK